MVKVVACFVTCGDFDTVECWKRWKDDHVGYAIHAAHVSKEDDAKISEFVRETNALRIPEVYTQWSSFEVVIAQEKLLTSARLHYPEATHFLIVSQNSIPMVSTHDLLQKICDRCASKSLFDWYSWDTQGTVEEQLMNAFGMCAVASKQFVIWSREHIDSCSDMTLKIANYGITHAMYPSKTIPIAPDEYVRQSVFWHLHGSNEWCASMCVIAHFKPNSERASYRTRAFLKYKVPILIQRTRTIESPAAFFDCLCYGVRKVRRADVDFAINVLTAQKVLPAVRNVSRVGRILS
jgi:hypothetical protein